VSLGRSPAADQVGRTDGKLSTFPRLRPVAGCPRLVPAGWRIVQPRAGRCVASRASSASRALWRVASARRAAARAQPRATPSARRRIQPQRRIHRSSAVELQAANAGFSLSEARLRVHPGAKWRPISLGTVRQEGRWRPGCGPGGRRFESTRSPVTEAPAPITPTERRHWVRSEPVTPPAGQPVP